MRHEHADTNAPIAISVIIPARNAAPDLVHQLSALAQQTYTGPMQVIVADNGSVDNTREVVRSWSEQLDIMIIDASRAPGINVARNEGSDAASGQLLLYCDADDIVSNQWVSGMANHAPRADLLGGSVETASINGSLLCKTFPAHPLGNGLATARSFLPYAAGCNFGIKASVLSDIGGWNEDYVGGCDDIELCWRAQLKGYKLGFVPDAVVHYRYRADAKGQMRQAFAYARNDARLYRDFRQHGMPRRLFSEAVRNLAGLVLAIPNIRTPYGRFRLLRRAARLFGHIRGSVEQRVFYF